MVQKLNESTYKAVSDLETLEIPFKVSSHRHGIVTATIQPSKDPAHYGLNLIFPSLPASKFEGFPLCKATVHSTGMQGYGAIYGWIQVTRDTANEHGLNGSQDAWEMDPVPVFSDLNTPFCCLGVEPTLFDGPARVDCERIDWVCRSFLTSVDDALMSKKVRPVLGFEWGFWIVEGVVRCKVLKRIEVGAWDEHLGLFRGKYQGWEFLESKG